MKCEELDNITKTFIQKKEGGKKKKKERKKKKENPLSNWTINLKIGTETNKQKQTKRKACNNKTTTGQTVSTVTQDNQK